MLKTNWLLGISLSWFHKLSNFATYAKLQVLFHFKRKLEFFGFAQASSARYCRGYNSGILSGIFNSIHLHPWCAKVQQALYRALIQNSEYTTVCNLNFVCRMLRSLCVSHLGVTMPEVTSFTILESFRSTFGVLTANLKPLTTVWG